MLELDFICLFSRYKMKQSKKNKLSFREKNGKQQAKQKKLETSNKKYNSRWQKISHKEHCRRGLSLSQAIHYVAIHPSIQEQSLKALDISMYFYSQDSNVDLASYKIPKQ